MKQFPFQGGQGDVETECRYRNQQRRHCEVLRSSPRNGQRTANGNMDCFVPRNDGRARSKQGTNIK